MGITEEMSGLSEVLASRHKSILRFMTVLVCLAFVLPANAQRYSFRYSAQKMG